LRITRIESQKRRPGRKNIYADGKFLAGVSAETLLRLALRTGDEIGPGQLSALMKTEELVSARNTALRFLATRPRTLREIRNKLREKEFPEEEIQRVITDLTAAGLLNDEEFARMFVRNALAIRPTGHLVVKRKLLALGIPKAIAEEAVAEEMPPESAHEQALKAAKQFLRRSRTRQQKEPAIKLRSRLAGFLARRGFGWETIDPVLRTLLHQPAENPNE
jgi:regulatory protein